METLNGDSGRHLKGTGDVDLLKIQVDVKILQRIKKKARQIDSNRSNLEEWCRFLVW